MRVKFTPAVHHELLRKLVGVVVAETSIAPDHQSNHTDCNNKEPYDMTPRLLHIPQSAYTALRKGCNTDISSAEIIGNDLVCAFIWRTVMRAFAATTAKPLPSNTKVSIPFDARPSLLPSSQISYLGNMNFETTLSISLDALISSEMTILSLAKTIPARAKENTEQSTLLAAYDLLRSIPQYGKQEIHVTSMPPEEAAVGIQSPIVLPFNDTCFSDSVFGNGGRVESFRPIMGEPNRGYRTCFVVPRKQHGGLEFVMSLTEKEMEWLRDDDEFNEYAFAL